MAAENEELWLADYQSHLYPLNFSFIIRIYYCAENQVVPIRKYVGVIIAHNETINIRYLIEIMYTINWVKVNICLKDKDFRWINTCRSTYFLWIS